MARDRKHKPKRIGPGIPDESLNHDTPTSLASAIEQSKNDRARSMMDLTDVDVRAEIKRFTQWGEDHPEALDRLIHEMCAIRRQTLDQEQKERVERGRRSTRPKKYIH